MSKRELCVGLLPVSIGFRCLLVSTTDATQQWITLGPKMPKTAAAQADVDGPEQVQLSEYISGLWLTPRDAAVAAAAPHTNITDQATLSQVYDRVSIPDFSHILDVGSPQLPLKTYMVPVEAGSVVSVQLNILQTADLPPLHVIPVQELPPDVYPEPEPGPFEVNETIYSADALYPENPLVSVKTIRMRDQEVAVIQVAPVQVNPVDQTTVIHFEYELQITTEAPADPDVGNFSNGDDTPVVFSINCNSGMYNFSNNFSKRWLIDSNGGAYAVFAPVDSSYSWLNDWMTHGFYTGFLSGYVSGHNASSSPDWPKNLPTPRGSYGAAGSAKRLGQILNFGKMYMYEHYSTSETTFRLFHLFGDPESYLRIRTPQTLSVSHDSQSFGATQTIEVNVNQADTTVCLYCTELGIHEVATPSGGVATFSTLSVGGSGTGYITVTGPNVRPYEGTIALYAGNSLFEFRAFGLAGKVCLRWTDPQLCGRATAKVKITAATDTYPATPNHGRVVYIGTAQQAVDDGLSNGVQQYYSIWGTDDGVNDVQPQ